MTDFDNSTCERVLDLLDAVYLRLSEIVVKVITIIKFGANDGSGNGRKQQARRFDAGEGCLRRPA